MDVALQELFTTDIGLLSVFTIGFIIVMAIYIYFYVRAKMAADEEAARNRGEEF